MARWEDRWAGLKITIIVEGNTEKAFLPALRSFLATRLTDRMPVIDVFAYDGRIPKGEKLKRVVGNLLSTGRFSDYVIALTDVYTGSPDFKDSADAKQKMRE